jgi:MYXO-CTERM domain-containing protein
MMIRTLCIALLLLALPAAALADVPQPADYVESCDLKYYEKPGVLCKGCSAWHGEPDACKPLGDEGYANQCRTAGASTWGEVWCKLDPAWTGEPVSITVDLPVLEKDEKTAKRKALVSCSSTGTRGASLLALLVLGLALVRRR